MMLLTVKALRTLVKTLMSIVLFGGLGAAHALNFTGVADDYIGSAGNVYNSGNYSIDNFPWRIAGATISKRDPLKWRTINWQCTGLDFEPAAGLKIVGQYNGQDIYRLTDTVGFILWAGDTNVGTRPEATVNGAGRREVFGRWCSLGGGQGYSLHVIPVIYKRLSPGSVEVIPQTKVGTFTIMRRDGSTSPAFTGDTSFSVFLNAFSIRSQARTCSVPQSTKNQTIRLATVSKNSLSKPGDEAGAGIATLNLQCDIGVTVFATLTDQIKPSNISDILTTRSGEGMAEGVGLRLYRLRDNQRLSFGPDSPLKGNINQWQLSESMETAPMVRLKINYVNTGSSITPGEVNAISTVTFSYQ